MAIWTKTYTTQIIYAIKINFHTIFNPGKSPKNFFLKKNIKIVTKAIKDNKKDPNIWAKEYDLSSMKARANQTKRIETKNLIPINGTENNLFINFILQLSRKKNTQATCA